jgi:PDDEXK-like domain of unknown function (DUF3799)
VKRPEKCENCGFSSRHCRQKPGEKLAYCGGCHAWICFGCRALRNCLERGHEFTETPVATELRSAAPPNDGIYSAVPDTVYHGDHDSLSSSGARDLLTLTPAQFDYNRHEPPDPKPQYDFGHAAHKMVLGEGHHLVRVDAADWRTKDAQIKRRQAWDHGKAPLLKKDIDKAQRMAGAALAHPLAGRLFAEGSAEMSIYWHDDTTGVRRRCRPDFITDGTGRPICVDYKSAISADPADFEKAVMSYGYHQQQAWYEDGLTEIGLDTAGFLFVVQCKTAPFLVSVCRIKPEIVELGRRLNRQSLELYARCVEAAEWPGYDDHTIHEVGMPAWAVTRTEQALEVA